MDSKLQRKRFTASCCSHFATSNIKGSHELEFCSITVRDTFVTRLERCDDCALFTIPFWRRVPSPLLAKNQGKQLLYPWGRNTAASGVKCQVCGRLGQTEITNTRGSHGFQDSPCTYKNWATPEKEFLMVAIQTLRRGLPFQKASETCWTGTKFLSKAQATSLGLL